jgi:hypothetical protein
MLGFSLTSSVVYFLDILSVKWHVPDPTSPAIRVAAGVITFVIWVYVGYLLYEGKEKMERG